MDDRGGGRNGLVKHDEIKMRPFHNLNNGSLGFSLYKGAAM